MAADSLDEVFIGSGPPELFVVVDGAENGINPGREHEVAGSQVFQQCLHEGDKMPAVATAEFQRRGVAAGGEKLRIDADIFNKLRKPLFAPKVELKSPMA